MGFPKGQNINGVVVYSLEEQEIQASPNIADAGSISIPVPWFSEGYSKGMASIGLNAAAAVTTWSLSVQGLRSQVKNNTPLAITPVLVLIPALTTVIGKAARLAISWENSLLPGNMLYHDGSNLDISQSLPGFPVWQQNVDILNFSISNNSGNGTAIVLSDYVFSLRV